MTGSILVLESTGSKITDDDVLEYYALNDNCPIFMLLNDSEKWESILLKTSETTNYSNFDVSENTTLEHIAHCSNNNETNATEFILIDESVMAENPRNINITEQSTFSFLDTNFDRSSLFLDFEIPWHKMPVDVSNCLENKKKLGKRLNAFANIVVDEMRAISNHVPMRTYRNVVEKIAAKYPNTFTELDSNGEEIGIAILPLITMMRNRNNFLNRSSIEKRKSQRNLHIKNLKKQRFFESNCKTWQPDANNEDENMTGKRSYMETLIKNKINLDKNSTKIVIQYMKDCYSLERLFFNNTDPIPSIVSIKKNWPFIFMKECFLNHFAELTNVSVNSLENCSVASNKAVDFFKKCRIVKIKKLTINDSEEYLLNAVSNYFNENASMIYKKFEVCQK